MWHVSISRGPVASRRLLALRVLQDCGDAAAGEWWEQGEIATHLRRRLTAREAEGVGPVVDVRDTPEARRRYAAVRRYLPPDTPLV